MQLSLRRVASAWKEERCHTISRNVDLGRKVRESHTNRYSRRSAERGSVHRRDCRDAGESDDHGPNATKSLEIAVSYRAAACERQAARNMPERNQTRIPTHSMPHLPRLVVVRGRNHVMDRRHLRSHLPAASHRPSIQMPPPSRGLLACIGSVIVVMPTLYADD